MMSDNDIRKDFQSKLGGFQAPVPPDGWERVERSLEAAAAARTVVLRRRRWYAGSAAAVLILLIGSILFMRNPAEQTDSLITESTPTIPITDHKPDPVVKAGDGEVPAPEVVTQPDATKQLLAARVTGRMPAVNPIAPGSIVEAWLEREELQVKDVDERINTNALQQLAMSIEEDAAQYGKDLHEEEAIVVEGDEGILFADASTESGEGTLLLAFNGKGGMSGYHQMVNLPMTLRSASAAPENKYASESQNLQTMVSKMAENTSEIEHDQPVSFGITVSKFLFDDLSVETGLVYSYLHSKTRNASNNFKVEEVQKLHYLGIPVNVNYNIISFGGLNIYASVGGMIEKDIHGEFRRSMEGEAMSLNKATEESNDNEVTKISQRNPQLSINAGVGLSYPIYDKLRLYGKIGGAYYFDAKNEYKTIYSDRKIVMDLNLGLRYEF